jgi:methionyl-tRNA synthetase
MTKSFYITTPIYYVNDVPHIGHAYTTLAADVAARFKRLDGYKVKYLTGTDEHGQKVAKSAEKAGVTPQEFTDNVSQKFRDLIGVLNLSCDDFIRTTEERHKRGARELWNRLIESGNIYLGSYSGWYSTRDEAFYAESEIVDGLAPSGAPVEWLEEPSYFFKLSAWQDKLLAFYEKHPDFIRPQARKNEVISFVKSGLLDLSVSRTSFDWGIKIPGDEKHVMYVWLDALTNYISALGFPDETSDYKDFWPNSYHIMGKDILRFHAVYWPAFLMAAGLTPPKSVYAHGWWTVEGEKMSKSLGNAIPPASLINEFGLDQTRYFLLKEFPFGNDGNFSRDGMITRVNAELANNIGNLVQRTLSMINKNCAEQVPNCPEGFIKENDLLEFAYNILPEIRENMDQFNFSKVLELIVEISSRANQYIDEQAPWLLKKENPEKMEAVLYVLADAIRIIGILLQAFIPDSAGRILDLLAIPQNKRDFSNINPKNRLISGTILPKPEGIFPRYQEEKVA